MTPKLSRIGRHSTARGVARALTALLQEKPASEHEALIDAAIHSLKEQKLRNIIPLLPQLVVQEWKRAEKSISASLTSAAQIPEDAKHALLQGLQNALGKDVDLRTHTDKDLLGGLSLSFNDERLDGSLRGALSALQSHLLHPL